MALLSRLLNLSVPLITVAIVGADLVAPSPVRAECGSYIVYTNPADRPTHEEPLGEHRAPTPCHGPQCSQMPPSAPMPSAPPSVRILVDQALVSLSESVVPPSFQPLLHDATDGDPVRRPSDIFHPPR